MAPFADQMQIELAEQRPEGVGVFRHLDALRPFDPQQIGVEARDEPLEQIGRARRLQMAKHGPAIARHHSDRPRSG